MTKYEDLINEYDGKCEVYETEMKLDGLYLDRYIWINSSLENRRKTAILTEEIGHYELTVGDILNLKDMANLKQEHKARVWAYKKLIPALNIYEAAANGYTTIWDIAEYLDVDEPFLIDCLKYYGILDI